jgi:hypothetical protein
MSGNTHPTIQYHIPEDLDPELQYCENLRSGNLQLLNGITYSFFRKIMLA